MFLKARFLELEARKPIVILNREDAQELDVKPLDRVELRVDKKKIIAIVNVAEEIIPKGEIGLYGIVQSELMLRMGQRVDVNPADPPESIGFIKKKLTGKALNPREIRQIVRDVVGQRLSDIEVTAFVISLYNHGISLEEAASLSRAMTETGERLDLGMKNIFDKHSIGGVPGDKTSILLVPIIASLGMVIPKTSSRSITSPAGTADRMECLCPVELDIKGIKRVVKKTNGCIVWGGSVDLSPADDDFIQIEYPLSIDPLLLPSVMSKKKSVGARYLVIDIPTGAGAKVKSVQEAQELAERFIKLGKKLGMNVECASTFGSQPVGHAIGPALEAREALRAIAYDGPHDLIDKVAHLASILLDFKRAKNSRQVVLETLKSGRAERKLREIIREQGGDPKIRPGDISIGSCRSEVRSSRTGTVLWVSNPSISMIAKEAGSPKDKGAGIIMYKKIGDHVKRGEPLFEIISEKAHKLKRALKTASMHNIIKIGKEGEMLLEEIPPGETEKKHFVLER